MIQKTRALWDSSMSIQCLKKKLRARCALDCSGKRIITTEDFIAICTTNLYAPSHERMTKCEAAQYLEKLQHAREVIVIGGYVYIRPSDVVNAVHLKLELPTLSRGNPMNLQQCPVQQSCATLRVEQKGGVRRREFWAIVSLLSGAQMTVLAYLTFIVYGWDVMEPVCYFVTTFTALCVYAYSLVCRRNCTFHAIDDQIFSPCTPPATQCSPVAREMSVADRTMCAGKDCFDSSSWDDDCELLELLESFDFTTIEAASNTKEMK
ncbi:hypothetical protein C3747_243g35 [Trypanosoma cruzi]|uniref:Calcium uniporter protein C-terminal domain-containing protein n=1 Tax=Trypanosoma cruzi TaxID=5693 RepID=A0A2V2VNX3_TRYCR|nr:hypothetical protein C3747_243g35 [Trypanosoma cruzi]RNC47124.1 hypothetical protein TcCL_NonESM03017 [Trypanosoma cruzi]